MRHRKTNATAPVLDSTRFFALSAAIAVNTRLRPDSSDPIRQDGLQGQVLAITPDNFTLIFVSQLYLISYLILRNVAALRGLAQQMRTVAAELS